MRADGVHSAEVLGRSANGIGVGFDEIHDGEMVWTSIACLDPLGWHGDVVFIDMDDDSRGSRRDDGVPRPAAKDAYLCRVECGPEELQQGLHTVHRSTGGGRGGTLRGGQWGGGGQHNEQTGGDLLLGDEPGGGW